MFGVVFQILLGILVLCITILYFYLRRIYGYWKDRGIPYEKPTMFVGNLGHLMRLSMWDYMYTLSKKHKTPYVGIFLGWKPALVINSKELAKKVFVTEYNSFQHRYSFGGGKDDPLGSLNLFTVKNPIWGAMRQEMTPMFTSLRLKGITELMNINSAELVRRVETDYIEKKMTVNLKDLFSMYTSDIVGHTVFGLKMSVLKDSASPLWNMTQNMVNWTFYRGFELAMILLVPSVASLFRFKFFSAGATKYVKKLFWDVSEKRKQLENPSNKELISSFLKLRENLQGRLQIDPNSKLAEDVMMAQAAVFLMGSIETSSTLLCYFFIELARHPHEQEKLYNEIYKATEDTGKDVLDFNDYMELRYLSACIKETLRMYPVLAFLDRHCNKTCKLTDDLTVEEGTPVHINVHAIHYNEKYYPEPTEWRPERFANSSDNDNRDFTFLTFGEGPRFCIGKRYGLMQVRTAIAHMVLKFRIDPDETFVVKNDPYSAILSINEGGRVKFIPR